MPWNRALINRVGRPASLGADFTMQASALAVCACVSAETAVLSAAPAVGARSGRRSASRRTRSGRSEKRCRSSLLDLDARRGEAWAVSGQSAPATAFETAPRASLVELGLVPMCGRASVKTRSAAATAAAMPANRYQRGVPTACRCGEPAASSKRPVGDARRSRNLCQRSKCRPGAGCERDLPAAPRARGDMRLGGGPLRCGQGAVDVAGEELFGMGHDSLSDGRGGEVGSLPGSHPGPSPEPERSGRGGRGT